MKRPPGKEQAVATAIPLLACHCRQHKQKAAEYCSDRQTDNLENSRTIHFTGVIGEVNVGRGTSCNLLRDRCLKSRAPDCDAAVGKHVIAVSKFFETGKGTNESGKNGHFRFLNPREKLLI